MDQKKKIYRIKIIPPKYFKVKAWFIRPCPGLKSGYEVKDFSWHINLN